MEKASMGLTETEIMVHLYINLIGTYMVHAQFSI